MNWLTTQSPSAHNNNLITLHEFGSKYPHNRKMHTVSQCLRMIWQISKFLAIHHIGVSSTNYALQYFGFDTKLKCQITARNIWCFFFSIFFTYCGIFWYVRELQEGLLGYLLSDLLSTFRMQQFNTLETWFHHLISIFLVICTMDNSQYHQHILILMGGFGEFSNVFLSITDTFKNIPRLQKRYPTVNTLARLLFGLSFTSLRVGLYTYVFIHFYNSGTIVERYTVSAIIILQYYWFVLISRQGLRQLRK